MQDTKIVAGSVVQITPAHNQMRGSNETKDREGWVGALVLVTEIKGWGVAGFIHKIESPKEFTKIWIRLSYDEIEYVGQALFTTSDCLPHK